MMGDRSYSIHGFVDVYIDADVRPEIVKEIDFQIGSFFVGGADQRVSDVPRIQVRPYAASTEYEVKGGSGEAVFYQNRGAIGRYVRDESGRFFVARDTRGFVICADFASFLINLYIQLLLVERGMTMSHAAAFKARDGGITLLAGAGGIGKTAVLGYAVAKLRLQHLGDDIVILDSTGLCRAFPRQFVLKSYHKEVYSQVFQERRISTWNAYALKRFIIENAPFVGVAKKLLRRSGWYYRVANLLRPQPFLATVTPDELFGAGTMVKEGRITRVIHMDRVVQNDSFSSHAVSSDILVDRLFSVIHYEWKDFLTHLVTLGALNVIDLPSYMEKVASIFGRAIVGSSHLQINIPEHVGPDELIKYLAEQDCF